jgi:hypothetical protein
MHERAGEGTGCVQAMMIGFLLAAAFFPARPGPASLGRMSLAVHPGSRLLEMVA